MKLDMEKEIEFFVYCGVVVVINGIECMFLDKYSDYFWFVLFFFFGIGLVVVWLCCFLNYDELDDDVSCCNCIFVLVLVVWEVCFENDLLVLQCEVDMVIIEMFKCYEDGVLEQEDMIVFVLVFNLFDYVVVE